MKPNKALREIWGKTHLVIPDPHATPEWNNDRFDWLAQWAVDHTPDVIVCIGDWADMASLCSYDKGTKGFEGRRYKEDIAVALDAQERFFRPIYAEIERRRRRKIKQWNPRFIMCVGNHDARIDTAIEKEAILDGTIGLSDLKYEDYWEVFPFKIPVVVDGIVYCHYLTSGVMGRPIGGLNHARSLLTKGMGSSTVGHSHIFDYAQQKAADGRRLHGLVCGVFTDQQMNYAGSQVNEMWWRGIVHKKNVKDGDYTMEMVSLQELKEMYSAK